MLICEATTVLQETLDIFEICTSSLHAYKAGMWFIVKDEFVRETNNNIGKRGNRSGHQEPSHANNTTTPPPLKSVSHRVASRQSQHAPPFAPMSSCTTLSCVFFVFAEIT